MALVNEKLIKFWEVLAACSLLVLLTIFVANLLFEFDHHIEHSLHMAEMIIIGIFMGEITLNLIYVEDKIAYLKRNWFYIFSVLPIVGVIRAAALADSARFARLLGFVADSRIVAQSPQLLRFLSVMPANLIFTKELVSLMVHMKRTDFSKVSPLKPAVPIHLYVSPHVPKEHLLALKEGMKEYMQHNFNRNIVFKHKDFLPMFKVETMLDHPENNIDIHAYAEGVAREHKKGINVVITDAALDYHHTNGIIDAELKEGSVSVVMSNQALKSKHEYAQERFEHDRGRVLGYHAFAGAFGPCYYQGADCIHHSLDQKNLDLMAFRLSTTGVYPLCQEHRKNK